MYRASSHCRPARWIEALQTARQKHPGKDNTDHAIEQQSSRLQTNKEFNLSSVSCFERRNSPTMIPAVVKIDMPHVSHRYGQAKDKDVGEAWCSRWDRN